MKSSSFKFLVAISFYLLGTLGAQAARVDMKDPRRALAREDDVRIDAQVLQTELSSSSPLSVTYQIQNLTNAPIAVADKTMEIDYDPETSTIVFSVGAEVPGGQTMPHLVVIRPGERKVFSAGGTVRVATPRVRTPWSVFPRYVQIKVVILRELDEFASLIDTQTKTATQPPLPNELFSQWVEASDSVFLNPIPIHWNAAPPRGVSAESPTFEAGGGGGGGRFD